MPSPFSITSATNGLRLDDQRQGRTTFTVFNAAGRPLGGRAHLVPDDEAASSWLSLEGEAERSFAIAAAEQYVVEVAVPKDAAAGSYRFRLDMVDVANPDEGHVQGPAVTFEAAEVVVVEPWWKEKMWMILVAVGVLVLGGIAAIFLIDGDGDGVEVPDVAGMFASQAEDSLDGLNFTFGPRKEELNDSVSVGRVIRTEPAAGEAVEEGGRVSLVVSIGPDLVAVPAVSTTELLAAAAKLNANDLLAKEPPNWQPHPSIQVGHVIRTNPTVGTEVERGSTITLFVSRGPSGRPFDPSIPQRYEHEMRRKQLPKYLEQGRVGGAVSLPSSFSNGTTQTHSIPQ